MHPPLILEETHYHDAKVMTINKRDYYDFCQIPFFTSEELLFQFNLQLFNE